MKKIVLAVVLGATSLFGAYSENAYIYKDPRIMGMGGTNVAIGGYSTSIFSNPAGIRQISQKHGWEVELLGLGVNGSSDIKNFKDDYDKADANKNDNYDTGDVLNKYSGKYFHVGASNYSSLSKNDKETAFSIGLLQAADVNFIPHANGGSEAPLELHARGYGGVTFALAHNFKMSDTSSVDIGLGIKGIAQKSYEGGLSITEFETQSNDDNLTDYVQAKYEKSSTGFGADIGVIYNFAKNSFWRPKVGLSLLNLGNLSMDENYGKQVMTLNAGFSISPEVGTIDHLTLGADLVDLLDAQETRAYAYNTNLVTTTKENADLMKKLRLGASLGVIDNQWFMLTLNGGLYQGSYSAGFDTQLTLVKVAFATYAEEIGTQTHSWEDRRYMMTIGLGW